VSSGRIREPGYIASPRAWQPTTTGAGSCCSGCRCTTTTLPPGSGPAEACAERLAFQAALKALAPKYRLPLVLSMHEGYRVAEIAQILNLGTSAVKMRLSRGREMFRQAYEKQMGHG
jgi:DNA-directed RNA polymerase specialized sigma24 family protein